MLFDTYFHKMLLKQKTAVFSFKTFQLFVVNLFSIFGGLKIIVQGPPGQSVRGAPGLPGPPGIPGVPGATGPLREHQEFVVGECGCNESIIERSIVRLTDVLPKGDKGDSGKEGQPGLSGLQVHVKLQDIRIGGLFKYIRAPCTIKNFKIYIQDRQVHVVLSWLQL